MAIILIPTAFVVLSACFLCLKGVGFRESMLKAALAMLVAIAISTEVLSRFKAIAPHPVAVLWQAVNLLALGFLLYLSRRRDGTRRMARKLRWLWSRTVLTRRAAVFVTLTAMVVFLTLVTAALQYPSDADSLSYHMPRVANWINLGRVEFYPTVNQRQNFFAPLSEYAMLHIQLLSGTDRFSIIPQYGSMLLALMLVAKLAARLGLGATGQWFAAAVTATIPILVAQSHSNQNELVSGALCLGFAWLLLQLGRRPSLAAILWCGGAFGLALLTKGTAFIYCAAIGLPLGLYALDRARAPAGAWARMAAGLTAAVVLGLSLNLPFISRCHRDGYNLLRNEYTTETRNERLGLDILAANAVRNAAMHFWLPSGAWNAPIEDRVRSWVGQQEANAESTFRGIRFQMNPDINCFYAGNPLHLLSALAALMLLPLTKRVPTRLLSFYVAAAALAALLFNLLLKWQYWGIRLQLPGFLLLMPLLAVVCFRIRLPRPFRALLQVGVAVALFIGALPALLFDQEVPLWKTAKAPLFLRDAESIRFNSTTPLLSGKSAQCDVVEFVRPFAADEVGLLVPRDNASYDYNWWVLFGNHARPGKPLLRHVASDTWPQPDYPPPEFVIAAGREPENGRIMGLPYKEVHRRGDVRVYARSR